MKRIGNLNARLEKEPYLYRIELLDRFYKMLDRKELIVVRPSCWSDPLENIIFNAPIFKNGELFEHPAKENIYAQCWSYEDDSYALWQIYTTKSDDRGRVKRHMGVRITTHLNRLVQISKQNEGAYYYGLVDYLYKKELDALPRNAKFLKGLGNIKLDESHLRTLLVKRKSYAYEHEVRLLAVPDKKHIDKNNPALCGLKIEPHEFISSVRLDPAMSEKEFKKAKALLVENYGFKPTQVSQSTLGRANRFSFNLDTI